MAWVMSKMGMLVLGITATIIILLLSAGGLENAKETVSKYANFTRGTEDITTNKPVVPEAEDEVITKLVSTINTMIASPDVNCFMNYDQLPEFGEGGTSLQFTQNGNNAALQLLAGAGGKQRAKRIEIPGMSPCAIGGPGVAENFYNSFIVHQTVEEGDERQIFRPYYTKVSSFQIKHDTSGFDENRINYGAGFVDFEDNGWLFKARDGSICFFPTQDVINGEEGMNDDNVEKLNQLVGKSLKKCGTKTTKINIQYGFFDSLGEKKVELTYFFAPGLNAWTHEGQKLNIVFNTIEEDLIGKSAEEGYAYFRNYEMPKPWAVRSITGVPPPNMNPLTTFAIDFVEGPTYFIFDRNENEWFFTIPHNEGLRKWKSAGSGLVAQRSFYFLLDRLGDMGEDEGYEFLDADNDIVVAGVESKIGDTKTYTFTLPDTGEVYVRYDRVKQEWEYRLPVTDDIEGVYVKVPEDVEQNTLFYRILRELGGQNMEDGTKFLQSFKNTNPEGVDRVWDSEGEYIFDFTSSDPIHFSYVGLTVGGESSWFYAYGNQDGSRNVWIPVPVDSTGASNRNQVLLDLFLLNEERGTKYLAGLNLHDVGSTIQGVSLETTVGGES